MKYLFCTALFLFFFAQSNAQSENTILDFIQSHKDESAFFLKENDSVIASLHPDRLMPLASTMKIMVAIEFSKQAAHHVFNPASKVALTELDRYYLPNTDGGAHNAWINALKQEKKLEGDSVSLMDAAKGMILFSSNANTEFLMDLLGLENINNNYGLMGVKDFTPLYYYVSALMLYQNPKQLKEGKILKQIRELGTANYIKAAAMIHNQLKNNPDYKAHFRQQDLTMAFQKEWSDKLPQSTVRAYTHIAEIINNRKIYNAETYHVLSQILETVMENPANRQWLDHAGMNGGSTMTILTKTVYATLKSGVRIEFAYFINGLKDNEMPALAKEMNAFELKILSDKKFRGRLAGAFQ